MLLPFAIKRGVPGVILWLPPETRLLAEFPGDFQTGSPRCRYSLTQINITVYQGPRGIDDLPLNQATHRQHPLPHRFQLGVDGGIAWGLLW